MPRTRPPIEELDPATAREADLVATWALEAALKREALPDEPVEPVEQTLLGYRHQPSYSHRRWFLARHGDRVVGKGACGWSDLPENRSHARVDVLVHPGTRGLGLGAALFEAALEAAVDAGCSLLDLSARVGGPGEPFLRALGAELRLVERRSVCRFEDLDRGLLEGWVRRAQERAAAYSLVWWDGPCPHELVEAYVELKHVMNTAPTGDLDRDDDRYTPDRWRELEAAWADQGYELWAVCARHESSGELAGFTELIFPRHWPEMAYQEDTGVWPKHRNRGLGRWLKAAMALRVLDDRPAVRRIETWNAGSNEAMLGINVAMGFRPLENWGEWQVPTERARKVLAGRAGRLALGA